MIVAPRAGVAGAGRPRRAGEGGPARLAHELVHGRGEGEFAAPEEAVQEFGHEGLQPVGADPPARLPKHSAAVATSGP